MDRLLDVAAGLVFNAGGYLALATVSVGLLLLPFWLWDRAWRHTRRHTKKL